MNDVKHIWVDPNLSLHPNHLVEPEHIESRFFMPEKQKLQENKDGSPSKQTRPKGKLKNHLPRKGAKHERI